MSEDPEEEEQSKGNKQDGNRSNWYKIILAQTYPVDDNNGHTQQLNKYTIEVVEIEELESCAYEIYERQESQVACYYQDDQLIVVLHSSPRQPIEPTYRVPQVRDIICFANLFEVYVHGIK